MFSDRINSIPASPIRKLAPYAAAAKAAGKRVIPLNIGQPDINTPDEYFKQISALSNPDSKVVAYGPSDGMEITRQAFSDYYKTIGVDIAADELLITTGGSEAISIAITCLCDAGDDIIIFEPFYANYASMAKQNCVNVVPITTTREKNFCLPSFEDMDRCVTPAAKALIITNPNNPTGSVYSKNEIEAVVRLAIKNNLFIITDEVYREFVYDGAKHTSFTQFPEINDRLIIIDSVSKRFSGCGVRVGCLATKNKEFLDEALKLCQARLCVSSLEQIGAAAMFKTDSSYIKAAVSEYNKRRDVLCEYLAKIDGVEFVKPQGAFYIIAKLPVENSDDFARWMLTDFSLNNETILLCPAADFYANRSLGENEIRISYCIRSEELIKAIFILRAGLEKYNKK